MDVVLEEMSAGEFAGRRAELVRDTADSLAGSRGLSVPEAEATAERSVAQAFEKGPHTAGQLVRTAWHQGQVVGWVWVSLSRAAMPGTAWIGDVVVDPPFRRQGAGAAIIAAVERELVERGEGRVGINVYDDAAIRLCERLGFAVVRQVRARSLRDVPGNLAAAVELVPITPGDYERRIGETEAAYPPEREVRKSMPHGPDTDGMTVRTALSGGETVGWVWYGLHGPDRPGMGWIYQLDVDEPHRSNGHGTAIIAAAEADLVRHGLRSVGLFVRGDNVQAQRLYDRLGFELMSQEMSKRLSQLL